MIIDSVSKTLSLHDPGVVQFPPLRLEYIANATNIRTKESNKRMEFLIKVNTKGIPGPINANFMLS